MFGTLPICKFSMPISISQCWEKEPLKSSQRPRIAFIFQLTSLCNVVHLSLVDTENFTEEDSSSLICTGKNFPSNLNVWHFCVPEGAVQPSL